MGIAYLSIFRMLSKSHLNHRDFALGACQGHLLSKQRQMSVFDIKVHLLIKDGKDDLEVRRQI